MPSDRARNGSLVAQEVGNPGATLADQHAQLVGHLLLVLLGPGGRSNDRPRNKDARGFRFVLDGRRDKANNRPGGLKDRILDQRQKLAPEVVVNRRIHESADRVKNDGRRLGLHVAHKNRDVQGKALDVLLVGRFPCDLRPLVEVRRNQNDPLALSVHRNDGIHQTSGHDDVGQQH